MVEKLVDPTLSSSIIHEKYLCTSIEALESKKASKQAVSQAHMGKTESEYKDDLRGSEETECLQENGSTGSYSQSKLVADSEAEETFLASETKPPLKRRRTLKSESKANMEGSEAYIPADIRHFLTPLR